MSEQYPDEMLIGIEARVLPRPTVEVSIKQDPQDFIVDEIPVQIPKSENGTYTIFKARLTNWDTNSFVIALARKLGISKERITYAGTKDKRGITTQYFCISGIFDLGTLNINGCDILESFYSVKKLELGDLVGNRFTIRVTPAIGDADALMERYNSLSMKGGFPNFFGPQRFGSLRPNTHTIGELILNGKYEEAVRLYLYDPRYDREDFRVSFGESGDVRKALQDYPLHLSFERSLLGYVQEHGKYEGAFDVFPRYLRMMFVHAYQSYLFNKILSQRIVDTGSASAIFPGDIVYPVDGFFNPAPGNAITVNSFNVEKIQALSEQDRVRPTIPLPGYETKLSTGKPGELEKRVLQGMNLSVFRIPGHRDMWSKGSRRITSAKPVGFEIGGDDRLSFSLGKGIYATIFLRELFLLK
ncbi:MAG: tRNA pseudouridine(13) synthase TruD [Thermoplasmataceae archaeon]